MNLPIYAIEYFVSAFLVLSVGVYVFLTNKKSLPHIIFSLFYLSVSTWQFGFFYIFISDSKPEALFWGKIVWVGVIFIPTFFYHFTVNFLNKNLSRFQIPFLYSLSGFFLFSLYFTNWFINGSYEYFWGDYGKAGFLQYVFLPIFVTTFVRALYLWRKGYIEIKKKSILEYQRRKFVFLMASVGLLGGVDFLPNYGFELYPFAALPVTIALAIASYAIIRYRLMDITIVVNKGLAYGLLLGLIFVPTYLTILVSQRATFFSIPPLVAGTLIFSAGLWVVFKNSRSRPHLTFGLVSLGVCIWLFGMFLAYSAPNEQSAYFWNKIVYIGVFFIPASFYHFCVSFLSLKNKKNYVVTNYLISTLFLAFLPTNFILNGQYPYFWGYYPKAGVLHPFFLLYFALVTGASLNMLYSSYKVKQDQNPDQAVRIRYVFVAFVVGFMASIDFVQLYGFEVYPAKLF